MVLNKLKNLREVIIEVIDKRIENFDQNEKEGNDDMIQIYIAEMSNVRIN
jgi:hypothetical protein